MFKLYNIDDSNTFLQKLRAIHRTLMVISRCHTTTTFDLFSRQILSVMLYYILLVLELSLTDKCNNIFIK